MLIRIVLLVLLSAPTHATALPRDVSGQDWFDHCRRLSAQRLSAFPAVASYRISYAWHSDTAYIWDWENGNHAGDATHTCVRLALYNGQGAPIESVTLLCSVTGREKNTETWTFGNREIADRFCPMARSELDEMDKRAPKRVTSKPK